MRFRKSAILTLFLLALTSFVPVYAQPPQASSTAQLPTLYKRLGGYDALAAVTDDFIGRLASDPKLSRFFVTHNEEGLKRIRQHVVDFLCVSTGGPCVYTGQDMKTAHTGLKITEDEWNASMKHLVETLDKFKVPEKEKGEVLAAIAGLKGDIVGH